MLYCIKCAKIFMVRTNLLYLDVICILWCTDNCLNKSTTVISFNELIVNMLLVTSNLTYPDVKSIDILWCTLNCFNQSTMVIRRIKLIVNMFVMTTNLMYFYVICKLWCTVNWFNKSTIVIRSIKLIVTMFTGTTHVMYLDVIYMYKLWCI